MKEIKKIKKEIFMVLSISKITEANRSLSNFLRKTNYFYTIVAKILHLDFRLMIKRNSCHLF